MRCQSTKGNLHLEESYHELFLSGQVSHDTRTSTARYRRSPYRESRKLLDQNTRLSSSAGNFDKMLIRE